ncbi:MAG: hypothetical protein QOC94_4896 [Actinoplanes sp.]|nr:hypothetical protein [Actinoplanes sp.]
MTATTDRAALPRQRLGAASVLAATRNGHRPDVEGLRAVAVLLVVLGHAGVPLLAGGYIGVDVFFVISGFLITSVLLRETAATGRIAVGRFYSRRVLRLLPAAGVVLLATVAGVRLWLPPDRYAEFSKDALAAIGYFANFRFASTGTDYLSAGNTPSPFQHFWSLAVEEQFYLLWPLLVAGLSMVFRRRRVALAVMLTVVIGVSLTLSVTVTEQSAPWAYFGAHTRAWELGVGALLAVAATRISRLPVRAATWLGWLGLMAIGTAALAFDADTAYPGWLALLPVLGAAAVIAAGLGGRPMRGAGALLELWPMLGIGRLSYGWYLWHWPLLMIAPAALGVDGSTEINLMLAVVALGLAWLTFHLVEDPVRNGTLRHRPARGLTVGAAVSAAVVLAALLAGQAAAPVPSGPSVRDLQAAVDSAKDPTRLLHRYLAEAGSATRLPRNLTPAIGRVGYDKPRVYADGCMVDSAATTLPRGCVYGDLTAKTTVVLFGDSHAAQWFPALEQIARQHSWRLVSLTKSACTAADVPIYHETLKRAYTECQEYHRNAVTTIGRLAPAMIVVASSFDYRLADRTDDAVAQWQDGWASTFTALRATGASVVAITDTPYPATRVPSCLSLWPTGIGRCNTPLRDALRGPDQRAIFHAYARQGTVAVIDPTSWLCSAICPAVLGNTVVYRDNSHLSTAYAATLAPLLTPRLLPLMRTTG